MTKYSVIDNKIEIYEPEIKLAFLNILAGIIWAIPFVQKVFPNVNDFIGLAIGFAFVIVYIIVSIIPLISFVPCVGAVIIYTVMFWSIVDGIGHDELKIIVKTVVLLLVVFIELVVFGNSTLRWAQFKFSKPPRTIREQK